MRPDHLQKAAQLRERALNVDSKSKLYVFKGAHLRNYLRKLPQAELLVAALQKVLYRRKDPHVLERAVFQVAQRQNAVKAHFQK